MNFTGITSPYEPPENPEIVVDTDRMSPEDAARVILDRLEERGLVPGIREESNPTPST